MYQVIEGVERPIAFISKAYDKPMLKWSAYMKEGFAIYYALKKWRHLLLDRPFTLQTDCRNLSFLEKDNDSKVLRWLTTFQEYEFVVEHVPGKDNYVADSFSRLCVLGSHSVEDIIDQEIHRPIFTSSSLPTESSELLEVTNVFIRALRSGFNRDSSPIPSSSRSGRGGLRIKPLKSKPDTNQSDRLESELPSILSSRLESDYSEQSNIPLPHTDMLIMGDRSPSGVVSSVTDEKCLLSKR